MAWPSVYSSITPRTIAAVSGSSPVRAAAASVCSTWRRVLGPKRGRCPKASRVQAQRLAPAVGQRLGEEDLGDDGVEHQVHEVVLAGDVRVDAHGPDPELAGHSADGDRAQALAIGDRHRGSHDGVAREPAPGIGGGRVPVELGGGAIRHRLTV